MRDFFAAVFAENSEERKRAMEIIDGQIAKADNPLLYNYACRVAREFAGGFVEKGLVWADKMFNESKQS